MKIDDLHTLIETSNRRLNLTELSFVRESYMHIEWESRLILLKGCRGVGKSYLMLQHLKKTNEKAIYLSLDNLFFIEHTLSSIVNVLYNEGYKLFAFDEIHKYPNWSIELKNLYDSYPDLKMIVTSSAALRVMEGMGDLSRRMDIYTIKGMSFSEYHELEYKTLLPSFTFEELLADHEHIYETYYESYEIEKKFKAYLKKTYYPFYKESGTKYHERLHAIILQVIDADILAIFNLDYESTRQIKKLLSLLCRIGPFIPNIAKLSRDLGMSRNSVLLYLDYLSEAGIINILKSMAKSDSALTKPDKVFLENTNLLYAFNASTVNTGTLRETFVLNALINSGEVSTPAKGDFLYKNTYAIEVGGANKDFHQLYGMPNGILVKEGIAKGAKDILPMWMLAFLKRKASTSFDARL